MNLRFITHSLLSVAAAMVLISCGSYRASVTNSQGRLIPVDATWDARADQSIASCINTYKSQIEQIMNQPIGKAATTLKVFQPESPLSNLTADMLKSVTSKYLGKPVDMGVINLGGLRTTLTEGVITVGNIYEIFPFENTVIILTLKGEDVRHLFEEMAFRGGEGISGAQLVITKKGKLKSCTINGKPVDPKAEYTIGTIDYLAEGNDGMGSFKKAVRRQDLPDALLRDVFMDYVKEQAAHGKSIDSKCDNRVKVVAE